MNESINISGYASLFGIRDLSGDIVERGAFAKSLTELPAKSIRMLYQHDSNKPIGHWSRAFEDDKGLWVEGRIYGQSEYASLAKSQVKNGRIDGLSIGFRTIDYSPTKGGRILKQIDLREVSIVGFPMLPRARLRVNG